MPGHDAREARMLGLWTATWLFVLLLAGLLWVGDLSLQWPVLLIPALWALVAMRPRRTAGPAHTRLPRARPPDAWDPIPPPIRTDTVQRPAVRPRNRDRGS
jgi:hypothetical protein